MATLNELNPNPKNPRSISNEKLTALKKALLKFGDLGGFVFNGKSGQLVGGHQRAKLFPKSDIVITRKYNKPTKTGTVAEGFVRIAGERHKYREVLWDELTEKAANIAANKGGGEWDNEILGEWMEDLSKGGFDLDTTLFDETEREDFLNPTKNVAFTASAAVPGEDDIPEVSKRTITKSGDLIQLGPHRLLCADSTKEKNVRKLLGNFKVDLIFTDPPYHQLIGGANFDGGRENRTRLAESGLNDFDAAPFLEILRALRPQTSYIFCSKDLFVDYIAYFKKAALNWNLLAMRKTNPMPVHNNTFMPDAEWFFVARRKNAYFNNDLDHATYLKIRDIACKKSEYGHPTEKQVGFIEPYLQLSCPNGGVVLDLFGGSGTTMIAAEKLSRRCFMLEMNPVYCDVIVARWEKFTGKKAKRL